MKHTATKCPDSFLANVFTSNISDWTIFPFSSNWISVGPETNVIGATGFNGSMLTLILQVESSLDTISNIIGTCLAESII